MRLYIDPNYTSPVINIIQTLHDLQFPKNYEVVTGSWSDKYQAVDTVVFLVDTNKRGLNLITKNHYSEGYNVIAYKKPEGEPFDPFKCSLIMLSQWRRILVDLDNATKNILISIGNGKHPYKTLNDTLNL